MPQDGILESILRANPAYRIVPYDRLRSDQQSLLGDLAMDDDFYGLCIADDPELSTKSICQNTALLLYTLDTPGRLPSYVSRGMDDDVSELVSRLVCDGLLEVEQKDGTFASGVLAHRSIVVSNRILAETVSTDPLSASAIRYGATLSSVDPLKRSARMYFFNRLPMTPSISRRFPGELDVAAFLGLDSVPINDLLARSWTETGDAKTGWRMWKCNRGRMNGMVFKLYLCPHFQALPEVLKSCVPVFAEYDVPAFKIVRDRFGLLRPDKFVAYFADEPHLRETACALGRYLPDVASQGIPFTAPLDDDVGSTSDLLAWGIDPHLEVRLPNWMEQRSWRSWVTARLAASLATAQRQDASIPEAVAFALDRLRMEGVDPATWTPT